MKKIFLTLGVAALSLSSFASQRILYQQNFETASGVDETGWSYNGGSITIASDEYGKFLELSLGQNNGRSGQVVWGAEIFQDENGASVLEDGTYSVFFDFSIKANATNQFNSEITLFTNHVPTNNTNQPYRLPWSGTLGPWNSYLFDVAQCNTAADADMLATINAPLKAETVTDDEGNETTTYTIDTSESFTLATGNWYSVELNVNTETREVEYVVVDLSGNELTSGTWTVPENNLNEAAEPVSMFAEGLYVMMARYQSVFLFDNIKISYESKDDYANPPTIALTSLGKDAEDNLNLNMRTYTITFLDGETLHILGTDGQTEEVEWSDCDGAATYSTTTSGTLKAWTTSGDATSEEVSVDVDCTPCPLPAVTATISSVEVGFGKTYTLTVSNSETPLRPTIFIDYEFVGNDGTTFKEEGVASGTQVAVPGVGVLKLTSTAFGYQSTTVAVDNDLEFELKKLYDFARLTDEEQTAAGFTSFSVLNSAATSGFDNWTARKRLFYYDAATETVNDEGEKVYTAVYPFGYMSDDNTTNVVEYCVLPTDENAAGQLHFPGLDVYAGHNIGYMKHIGVYNDETSGGNYKNIDVFDLDATDFIVANRINNYGGNSCHPVVNTVEEYYAALEGENEVFAASAGTLNDETGMYTVSVPVYRIDTVCSKLTIFAQKGGAGIDNVVVDGVETNNDPYYYTIDGLRLAQPTQPGLYIHQGKKIVVK